MIVGRGLVVDVDRALRQHARQERRDDGVAVGRRRAERDERVHVGRAVAARGQAGAVEPPARPELDRRGEREQPRARASARDERRRARRAHRGPAIGTISSRKMRHREASGRRSSRRRSARRSGSRASRSASSAVLPALDLHHVVASLADGRSIRAVGPRRARDAPRPLGRQVDARIEDALAPCRARSTRPTQAAQVIPPTVRLISSTRTLYPVFRTTSARAAGVVAAGS